MKSNLNIIALILALSTVGKANAANPIPKDSSSPVVRTVSSYKTGYPGRSFHFFTPHPEKPVEAKKFSFSVVLTPDFTPTIPPVSLYIERGIAQFTSLGMNLGLSYNSNKKEDYHEATVVIGARACGYAIPALAVLGDKHVNSFGFDPYLGLTYNYYITGLTVSGEDATTFTGSDFGVVVGTRWYPGNKRGFGVLAEYGTTGITGGGIRFGITLGR